MSAPGGEKQTEERKPQGKPNMSGAQSRKLDQADLERLTAAAGELRRQNRRIERSSAQNGCEHGTLVRALPSVESLASAHLA